ncbi:CCC motif membrane protein [Nonlabens sp.]|uniref:CCC motif membrane protein n=1 Tax=Nonlabens sp. TaxID=1888209 RepID=UPI003F69C641
MQKLNTTLVYILSVVGFICCCFYGLGFVAALIAFLMANKELKKYAENPESYSNGPAMKTAKTVALVSLVVSGLVSAYLVYNYFTTTERERIEQGIEFYRSLGAPEEMIDAMENELDQIED